MKRLLPALLVCLSLHASAEPLKISGLAAGAGQFADWYTSYRFSLQGCYEANAWLATPAGAFRPGRAAIAKGAVMGLVTFDLWLAGLTSRHWLRLLARSTAYGVGAIGGVAAVRNIKTCV